MKGGDENMKTIKLKDLYPYLHEDAEVEIPDDVYEVLEEYRKKDVTHRSKTRYHKAYYSLDRGDGIELSAILKEKTPCEILQEKELEQQLFDAVMSLSGRQARRIYAYFYLDMPLKLIADIEDVSVPAVSQSILQGLKNLKKIVPAFIN